MIPPHQIEQVKSVANLTEIAQQYVGKLQRSGDHHVARCCFHTEKTASLHIWRNRASCFGCGFQGDVFTFLQAIEGWTLPQAVRYLADRYGIVLTNKRIPRAVMALARESDAHCSWWWKQNFLLMETVKTAAWRELLETTDDSAMEWMDFISGFIFRIESLPAKEKYEIYKACQPPLTEWKQSVAAIEREDKAFGYLVVSMLAEMQKRETPVFVA